MPPRSRHGVPNPSASRARVSRRALGTRQTSIAESRGYGARVVPPVLLELHTAQWALYLNSECLSCTFHLIFISYQPTTWLYGAMTAVDRLNPTGPADARHRGPAV